MYLPLSMECNIPLGGWEGGGGGSYNIEILFIWK